MPLFIKSFPRCALNGALMKKDLKNKFYISKDKG